MGHNLLSYWIDRAMRVTTQSEICTLVDNMVSLQVRDDIIEQTKSVAYEWKEINKVNGVGNTFIWD